MNTGMSVTRKIRLIGGYRLYRIWLGFLIYVARMPRSLAVRMNRYPKKSKDQAKELIASLMKLENLAEAKTISEIFDGDASY